MAHDVSFSSRLKKENEMTTALVKEEAHKLGRQAALTIRPGMI